MYIEFVVNDCHIRRCIGDVDKVAVEVAEVRTDVFFIVRQPTELTADNDILGLGLLNSRG